VKNKDGSTKGGREIVYVSPGGLGNRKTYIHVLAGDTRGGEGGKGEYWLFSRRGSVTGNRELESWGEGESSK